MTADAVLRRRDEPTLTFIEGSLAALAAPDVVGSIAGLNYYPRNDDSVMRQPRPTNDSSDNFRNRIILIICWTSPPQHLLTVLRFQMEVTNYFCAHSRSQEILQRKATMKVG